MELKKNSSLESLEQSTRIWNKKIDKLDIRRIEAIPTTAVLKFTGTQRKVFET